MLLAAPLAHAAAHAPSALVLAAQAQTGGTAASSDTGCILCGFIGSIEQSANKVIDTAYTGQGPHVQTLLSAALLVYFGWLALRLILGFAGAQELRSGVSTSFFTLGAINFANNQPLFEQWVVSPLRDKHVAARTRHVTARP